MALIPFFSEMIEHGLDCDHPDPGGYTTPSFSLILSEFFSPIQGAAKIQYCGDPQDHVY